MTEEIHLNITKMEAKEQQALAKASIARQVTSDDSFVESSENVFNPWAADKDKKEKFRSLDDRKKDVKELAKELKAAQTSNQLDDSAKRFADRNFPEMPASTLKKLLESLKDTDTFGEILDRVQDFFPDVSLADDALEFLLENTKEPLTEKVRLAKETLVEKYGTQIVAGRNIAAQAREFSEKGLGSPTGLRDLYRDITGNPREPSNLFDELSKNFSFEKLKTVIKFLLHALGTDLTSKGPSIPPGELARLFTETRSLQSILGVYRFFQSRMDLITKMFNSYGMATPKQVSFESLAKAFVRFLAEKYPSSVKILSSAQMYGNDEFLALIILISQWRDAVRNVSPRLYKNQKNKDDLLAAILEALEELEDQEDQRMQKLIAEEEEEKKKKKKRKFKDSKEEEEQKKKKLKNSKDEKEQ